MQTNDGAERFSAEDYERHYSLKVAGMERLLGPISPNVCHAIVGYAVGGPVDIYYFPHATEGTAFVTMELIEPDGTGPLPSTVGTFELVAFTRYELDDASSEPAFDAILLRLRSIFTTLGHYSTDALLNPGDTCEVPEDGGTNHFVVFDEFTSTERPLQIGNQTHALLLCIEVFSQEMEFAMQHGSRLLLDRLKSEGVYPYSDLDRQSTI